MKNLNKKILIPVVAVVLVLLVAGGMFLSSRKNAVKTQQSSMDGFIDEELPKLSPDEIGLSLVANPQKNAVKFIIAKAEGIDKIEMDFNYDADLPKTMSSEDGDGSGRIGRGGSDEITLNGKSRYESKFYDLGSCSSGTCKYDTGVDEVKILLKITKSDGKAYQVEDSIKL